MPALNDIAKNINQYIETNLIASSKFQNIKLFGIADYVVTQEEEREVILPNIIDNSGEGTSLMFDDTNTIQGYHVIKNLFYENSTIEFGDPNQQQTEVATIKFVLFGNRSKMQIRPEEFLASIALYIPMLSTRAADFHLTFLNCSPKNTEWNTNRAFREEFADSDYSLPLNVFMVTLEYEVRSVFDRKCYSLCGYSRTATTTTDINFYAGRFPQPFDANTTIGDVIRLVKNQDGNLVTSGWAYDITWSQRTTATYI